MENIVKKLDNETLKNIRQSARNSNRSSELGWWEECPRYLVLVRTDYDKMPLHDIDLQRIFDEGKKQEKLVRMELEEAGYEIIDVQRDEKWKHLNITGHIDGKIRLDGKTPIIEIKSCSPNVFHTISTIDKAEDLKNSKFFWIRGYYAQIQGYHLLFNEEEGIILFKNKSTAKKHQIDSYLDYEYCERMCKVIEEVNDRVEKNNPWPIEMKEACKRCPFQKTMCFPDMDYGPGFDFLSDEETETKLIRWEETKEVAKEHEELDKELKEHFKGRSVILGDFKIESSKHERRGVDLPPDIKKQYEKVTEYWITKIERL